MFETAFLIGVYSYSIFLLGVLHLLSPVVIIIYSVVFVLISLLLFGSKFKISLKGFSKPLLVLLFLQSIVNLIGVLGPELAFDSLWYHLAIPKIYLNSGSILFIPGNLLYYSGMPKLIEMLYLGGLSLGGDAIPKLIHFSFGLLTVLVTYKIAKTFVNKKLSLLASAIFYSNLVVGWESIAAFVDLPRAFFEALALFSFLLFLKSKKWVYFLLCGSLIGLSIATKTLAFGSLIIFLILLTCWLLTIKREFKKYVQVVLVFLFSTLVVSFPFYLTTYFWTGNPFYPIFDKVLILDKGFSFNLLNFPSFLFDLFLKSSDPISPIYVLVLPLILLTLVKFNTEEKILLSYSLLALLIVFITPHLGGGRFILPYLPAFSVLAVVPFKYLKDNFYLKCFNLIVIFILSLSVIYRFGANFKFLPLFFTQESKEKFMEKNLNFSFGDFYDIDGYFKKNIHRDDKVLVYGVHNLYYIDFPFAHYTYAKKGELYNYVLVQNSSLPERFSNLKEVYRNDITHVKLYTNGKKWAF